MPRNVEKFYRGGSSRHYIRIIHRVTFEFRLIKETISTNGLVASRGRELSPRYYESGEGELTDKLGYRPNEQPRLLFYLSGDYYGLIILNMSESPNFFPHASNVIVFRDAQNGNDAWFVLVNDDGREELYFSDTYKRRISCPE